MKSKNLKQRILYQARLSLIFETELKSFTDNQKLKEFNTKRTQHQFLQETSFTRNIKGTSISGKEKATIRKMKTMKEKGASPMAQ